MRTTVSVGTRVLATAMLGVLGCDGGASEPTVAQIDQQVHTAACRYYVKCGGMPDVGTCLASTHSPLDPQMIADLTAGRVRYDAAAGRRYLAAIDALSCRQRDRDRVAEVNQVLLARAAFQGTIPIGGSCYVDQECAGGTCDQPGVDGCPQGTCVALPSFLPPGALCGGAPDLCDGPYYCGPTTVLPESATCVPLPQAGEPCDMSFFGNGCSAGLICDSLLGAGSCTTPLDTGAACDPAQWLCDDDRDFCDTATATCQRLRAVGAACGLGEYCSSIARCDSSTGRCVAKGRLGEPCRAPTITDSDLPCLGNLVCDPATLKCVLGSEPPACP